MFGFVLIIFVTQHISLASLKDDDKNHKILPIVVGDFGQFRYMADVGYRGRIICFGAIISKWFVLTQNTCCRSPDPSYDVRVGSNVSLTGGAVIKIIKAYCVKNDEGQLTEDGVAVLRLENKLEFNKTVGKIKLPKRKDVIRKGTSVVIVGHNFDWPIRCPLDYSRRKHYFNTTIADWRTCAPNGSNKNDSLFCVELGHYGIEPCCQYPGMPLVTTKGKVLIGLHRKGESRCFGVQADCYSQKGGIVLDCAERKYRTIERSRLLEYIYEYNENQQVSQRIPSIYTSVIKHRKFIKENSGV